MYHSANTYVPLRRFSIYLRFAFNLSVLARKTRLPNARIKAVPNVLSPTTSWDQRHPTREVRGKVRRHSVQETKPWQVLELWSESGKSERRRSVLLHGGCKYVSASMRGVIAKRRKRKQVLPSNCPIYVLALRLNVTTAAEATVVMETESLVSNALDVAHRNATVITPNAGIVDITRNGKQSQKRWSRQVLPPYVGRVFPSFLPSILPILPSHPSFSFLVIKPGVMTERR